MDKNSINPIGSKKITELMAQNPPYLIRFGTLIGIMVVVVVFLVLMFTKFPGGGGERTYEHIIEKQYQQLVR